MKNGGGCGVATMLPKGKRKAVWEGAVEVGLFQLERLMHLHHDAPCITVSRLTFIVSFIRTRVKQL